MKSTPVMVERCSELWTLIVLGFTLALGSSSPILNYALHHQFLPTMDGPY